MRIPTKNKWDFFIVQICKVMIPFEGNCIVQNNFFKQKTAYEIRIRDWSSDVCSSD
eukprot:COSAG03_NODE_24783_length_270_cov_0.543860_1_plen_55_part_10